MSSCTPYHQPWEPWSIVQYACMHVLYMYDCWLVQSSLQPLHWIFIVKAMFVANIGALKWSGPHVRSDHHNWRDLSIWLPSKLTRCLTWQVGTQTSQAVSRVSRICFSMCPSAWVNGQGRIVISTKRCGTNIIWNEKIRNLSTTRAVWDVWWSNFFHSCRANAET